MTAESTFGAGTKLPAMVAALIDSVEITDEELSELYALIDERMKALKEKNEASK